jgi:hypothetical protein
MLTPGRGRNVNGKRPSTTVLRGNKYWKYLLWKYVTQLIEADEVPAYLNHATELCTENHNKTRSTRNCGYCKLTYGTEHHGHSQNELECPGYVSKHSEFKRARIVRKTEEREILGGFD